jgi:hypothetical protein
MKRATLQLLSGDTLVGDVRRAFAATGEVPWLYIALVLRMRGCPAREIDGEVRR